MGAAVAALLPGMCGMAAVCAIRNRAQRTVYSVSFRAAFGRRPGAQAIQANFGEWPFGGFPNLCSIASFGCTFVKQLGGEVTGALHWLCVAGVCSAAKKVCDVSGVCYDISTLSGDVPLYRKVGAGLDLILWVPGLDEIKLVEVSGKGAIIAARTEKALHAIALGCRKCFPAGTLVATPSGRKAIETLHVGDKVLAENPRTGKVEAEPVLAVIKDPISTLMTITLSGGTTIQVTPDHPFWLDRGVGLAGAGWIEAGQLQVGDQLRTADPADATVVAVRMNTGRAAVYTLSVARDHDFFVGRADLLVHNSPVFIFIGARSGSKKSDIQQIEDVARELHMTQEQRHEFGDYVEELKREAGKTGGVHLEYAEVLQFGKDFLACGGF